MKLSSVLRRGESGCMSFWCPGCDESHTIRVGAAQSPNWTWDGNTEAPTFSPSVKVTSGHFVKGHKPGEPCWCTFNQENPADPARFKCGICHSYVRRGQIQFLDDCTHALKGRTVPLPAWPEGVES